MPGGVNLAGKAGIGVRRVEGYITDGPAGIGQVLIGVVEVRAVKADALSGGHAVSHHSIAAVLTDDNLYCAVIIGAVVVVRAEGDGNRVAVAGIGRGFEVQGAEGVLAIGTAAVVIVVVDQAASVQGQGAGIEIAQVAVSVGGAEADPSEGAGVAAEVPVGVGKIDALEVHGSAGGYVIGNGPVGGGVGIIHGNRAGNFIAPVIHGGIGNGIAVGRTGHKVEAGNGGGAVAVVVAQAVPVAVGVEGAPAVGASEADGIEAVLSGQRREAAVQLVDDGTADDGAVGVPRAYGDVLACGRQGVYRIVSRVPADAYAGNVGQGLIRINGLGTGIRRRPALERVCTAGVRCEISRRTGIGGLAVGVDGLGVERSAAVHKCNRNRTRRGNYIAADIAHAVIICVCVVRFRRIAPADRADLPVLGRAAGVDAGDVFVGLLAGSRRAALCGAGVPVLRAVLGPGASGGVMVVICGRNRIFLAITARTHIYPQAALIAGGFLGKAVHQLQLMGFRLAFVTADCAFSHMI